MKKLLLFCLSMAIVGCNPALLEAPNVTAPDATVAADVGEDKPEDVEPAVEETTETETEAANTTEAEPKTADQAQVATEQSLDHANLLNQLLFEISNRAEGEAILAEIVASNDTRFVAGLIDTLRYQPGLSFELENALGKLTGQTDVGSDWHDWVEWAGKHPEIESFEAYPAWKGNLFSQIDPNFLRFVHAGMKVDPGSRVEEIVWGGVRVDGIPALDNPKMIDPSEADYLVPEERVFGVSINGDTRAYPARFLDWHEMFNDIVGGEPVSLAY